MMSDKTKNRAVEGHLARKNRAIQSIQEILGLDQRGYEAWLNEMTPLERSTHDTEVEQYMALCTLMADEHIQWSSQLLLGAPENPSSQSSNQSSMIAALGSVLLHELSQPTGRAVPQYLRKAAKQIERLIAAKKLFLEELLKQLRPDEKKAYGDMLKVCSPLMSAMPDLALYETFGRVDLAWKFRSSLIIKPQPGVPLSGLEAVIVRLHKRVTQLSSQALRPVLARYATEAKDSLPAKLLLATVVNRSHWEFLELERFQKLATESLLRLIAGLGKLGHSKIPAGRPKEAFRLWLLDQFCVERFADEESWRRLKPGHLERFYKQAAWILSWETRDFVEHYDNEETLLNLSVLCMTWSYCTHEKHDVRVPDVKDYDLVSGRDIERGESVPLTRIMYHQRQLNILARSQQHYRLSSMMLKVETACSEAGRRERMAYIRSNLNGISLAQWKGLRKGIFEVLAPLLTGHSEVQTAVAEPRP